MAQRYELPLRELRQAPHGCAVRPFPVCCLWLSRPARPRYSLPPY